MEKTAETKKLVKWFFVWDFEKEERWLNEMAADGWVLENVKFIAYSFRRCEPGEYILRLAMQRDEPGYMQLLEESGAEHVGHCNTWQYFRRKTELGAFELYTDLDSRIAQLNRIAQMLSILGVSNLIIGLCNSVNASHVGWVNLLVATLLMYALGRIHGKKEAIETERRIHE